MMIYSYRLATRRRSSCKLCGQRLQYTVSQFRRRASL